MRVRLGRQMGNLLPVAQQTKTSTNDVIGHRQNMGCWSSKLTVTIRNGFQEMCSEFSLGCQQSDGTFFLGPKIFGKDFGLGTYDRKNAVVSKGGRVSHEGLDWVGELLTFY